MKEAIVWTPRKAVKYDEAAWPPDFRPTNVHTFNRHETRDDARSLHDLGVYSSSLLSRPGRSLLLKRCCCCCGPTLSSWGSFRLRASTSHYCVNGPGRAQPRVTYGPGRAGTITPALSSSSTVPRMYILYGILDKRWAHCMPACCTRQLKGNNILLDNRLTLIVAISVSY
jgi:hypothetical protein